MPSSSNEATPPQGPEIWSVPFDPNSEIAHNTVVEEVIEFGHDGDVTFCLYLDVSPGITALGW